MPQTWYGNRFSFSNWVKFVYCLRGPKASKSAVFPFLIGLPISEVILKAIFWTLPSFPQVHVRCCSPAAPRKVKDVIIMCPKSLKASKGPFANYHQVLCRVPWSISSLWSFHTSGSLSELPTDVLTPFIVTAKVCKKISLSCLYLFPLPFQLSQHTWVFLFFQYAPTPHITFKTFRLLILDVA